MLKKQKINKSENGAGIKTNSDMNESWIRDLGLIIEKATFRYEKISLLTTVPLDWGVEKMIKEFMCLVEWSDKQKNYMWMVATPLILKKKLNLVYHFQI